MGPARPGGIIHQTWVAFCLPALQVVISKHLSTNSWSTLSWLPAGLTARIQSFRKDDPNYPDKNENPFYAVGVADFAGLL
jgi:hypothetical protein